MKRFLLVGIAALLFAGSATGQDRLPVLFVHGNGDRAANWMTTIWRFESNGYPADLLYAIDLPYPDATFDDRAPEPGESRLSDQAKIIAKAAQNILDQTNAERLILVANSRGGLNSLAYIRNFGGGQVASLLVAGGTPFHGVGCLPFLFQRFEFNGCGDISPPLLVPPIAPPDVRVVTLRSDKYDKFAQDYLDIGFMKLPWLGPGRDGPALLGADNMILPGLDHREVSFSPAAFVATWKAITGSAPTSSEYTAQSDVTLDGIITGYENGHPTNLPVEGVSIQVFRLDPETGARKDGAATDIVTGPDGRWGPITTRSNETLEWVIAAPGRPTKHVIRPAFARSTDILSFRVGRETEAPASPNSIILKRPAGYFDERGDVLLVNGVRPPDLGDRLVPSEDRVVYDLSRDTDRPIRIIYNIATVTLAATPDDGASYLEIQFHN